MKEDSCVSRPASLRCPRRLAHARRSKSATSTSRSAARSALYYLPLVITERLGYFKDEGLNVRISDFAGGTRSLEAVVGGSADVVAGAYEHTINMQSRKQNFQAFVLAGARAADQRRASRRKLADKYKSPKDLKGLKVGVSAPGSSTNMVINYAARAGRPQADRRGDHRRRAGRAR